MPSLMFSGLCLETLYFISGYILLYLIPASILNSSSFVAANKPGEGKRFIRILVKVVFRNYYTLFGC